MSPSDKLTKEEIEMKKMKIEMGCDAYAALEASISSQRRRIVDGFRLKVVYSHVEETAFQNLFWEAMDDIEEFERTQRRLMRMIQDPYRIEENED